MAKKNKTEEVKNNKGKSGSFLKDERFKVALGITVSGFAVLLFISFVSYLFTWKTDQSFQWSRVFSEPDFQVDNWSGKLGAYFSNLFINRWFGISSLAVPFMLLLMGFALMRIRIKNLSLILKATLVGMILASVWLGFILGSFQGILGSGLGGKHGLYLSQWLRAFAGTLGSRTYITCRHCNMDGLFKQEYTWMVITSFLHSNCKACMGCKKYRK